MCVCVCVCARVFVDVRAFLFMCVCVLVPASALARTCDSQLTGAMWQREGNAEGGSGHDSPRCPGTVSSATTGPPGDADTADAEAGAAAAPSGTNRGGSGGSSTSNEQELYLQHLTLQSVLRRGDGFTGINRKIQIKPSKWRLDSVRTAYAVGMNE
eukprot:GHVU01226455.1.p2 GENE.GHVU01226455.1~~GHVU01226455.1.p2  ORF type:complete len:156 (+),score=17.38 GHVU01226455.1:2565-3032(+)